MADFIGTTNLLSGVVADAGCVVLKTGERVPAAVDGHAPGAAVELGVRPESIALLPALADGALPARVEQAAYLGTSVSYLVRTTGGTALSVLVPKTGARLPVGADVSVSWDPADALLLGGSPPAAQEDGP